MQKILVIILVSIVFFSCKNSTNNNSNQNDSTVTTQNKQNNTSISDNTKYLTIIGDQIWVRSVPKTGDVVLKLNDGTQCEMLEKGELQIINGIEDYWYKIKYDGEEGWVFGSQTSLQQTSEVDEQSQIENFYTNFFQKIETQNYSDLKSYFIEDSVIVLYNPGAFLVYSMEHYTKALEKLSNVNFNGNINFSTMPTFDMDKFEWNENGFFVGENHEDNPITFLTQYGVYSQQLITKVTNLEKFISYDFLIAYEDGIYFHFGKVNSKWKIIAIDISTNDA